MARPVNIQFDNVILKKMSKQVEDQLSQLLYDEAQQENLKLQLAAIKFLQETNKVVEKINEYNKLQLKQAQIRNYMKTAVPVDVNQELLYQSNADKIRREFIENKTFDNFFRAVMIFNDKILEIITGAPMTTVIVVDGADGPDVREYTIQELLKPGSGIDFVTDYTSKSYALVGRIRIHTSELTKAASTISKKEQEKANFSLENLNKAYSDARIDYLANNPWAFFKHEDSKIWFKIKIAGGLGDISEAYTGFFFLKKPPFKSPSRWDNLTTYFEEGVAKVDAVSGLYTADILDEENKRNYAIKAANASLPGYTQMINLANRILDSSKKLDVKKLRQISEQKQYTYKNGEKIRKGLRNHIELATELIPEEWLVQLELTI